MKKKNKKLELTEKDLVTENLNCDIYDILDYNKNYLMKLVRDGNRTKIYAKEIK